jgi:hypothetical protein
MIRTAWLLVIAIAAACRGGAHPSGARPSGDGWRAFEDVAGVLQGPRCLNCHVPGDAPLQGDDGHRHNMNVKRGGDGRGALVLRCTTCHQSDNAELAHAPPGAPDWRLPPPEMRMAWQGLRTQELCEALKDPAHNGGRSLAALEDHLRNDAIVAWAFRPGIGRQPPRLSQPELVARFVEWKDAGAPCAANKTDGT